MKDDLKILVSYKRIDEDGTDSNFVCEVCEGSDWGTPKDGFNHVVKKLYQNQNPLYGDLDLNSFGLLRFHWKGNSVTFWQAYEKVDSETKAILLREWYSYVG